MSPEAQILEGSDPTPIYHPLSRRRWLWGVAGVTLGAVVFFTEPDPALPDLDIAFTAEDAEQTAIAWMRESGVDVDRYTLVAHTQAQWDGQAVEYRAERVGLDVALSPFGNELATAVWSVRFFEPGEKEEWTLSFLPHDTTLYRVKHTLPENAEGADLTEAEAKAIALQTGQDGAILDYAVGGPRYKEINAKGIAPLVAVPTTSGTGSEMGYAAVISDEAATAKRILYHPKLLARTVICDPELTMGLPANLTAWTGMDAAVHCIEAYCSPTYAPMHDGVALEGLRLCKDYLPRAYRDGTDIEARAQMMTAAAAGAILWRSFGNKPYLQFTSMGYTNFQNGNITYCPKDRSSRFRRQIVITVQGRPRLVHTRNLAGQPIDRQGRILRC